MLNRSVLWLFALDWLIDHLAATQSEVDGIVQRCLAVADGEPPDETDELARLLAEIRSEVAETPGFTVWGSVWRTELRRVLEGAAREWTWKTGSRDMLPTFEEYLENADNIGSAWVNVSHWIATADPQHLQDHAEPLQDASREVQRLLRLLNDLATFDRDVHWGDLNCLMLGVDRDTVNARIHATVNRCKTLIAPLKARFPQAAVYLERQMGYSMGFYQNSDYWGSL
ncbi:terpene synthase family protein [Streptomyces sp. NPDC007205]|uniref:terpene synthase family protein n=1 Tax=Streptomyces sp. NPDC007205 TaxID=3154316 RepID=UPI0033CE9F6D